MLAHRIPRGVTVVRDYGADVPRIEALAARAEPGVDEPHRQRPRRHGRARDAAGLHPGRRGAVVVEIGDTGAGMSPETQEHAFDPFYTTKGVGEGTGLGLDISRRIVDRHGGDISIDCGRARRSSGYGCPIPCGARRSEGARRGQRGVEVPGRNGAPCPGTTSVASPSTRSRCRRSCSRSPRTGRQRGPRGPPQVGERDHVVRRADQRRDVLRRVPRGREQPDTGLSWVPSAGRG